MSTWRRSRPISDTPPHEVVERGRGLLALLPALLGDAETTMICRLPTAGPSRCWARPRRKPRRARSPQPRTAVARAAGARRIAQIAGRPARPRRMPQAARRGAQPAGLKFGRAVLSRPPPGVRTSSPSRLPRHKRGTHVFDARFARTVRRPLTPAGAATWPPCRPGSRCDRHRSGSGCRGSDRPGRSPREPRSRCRSRPGSPRIRPPGAAAPRA